MRSSRSFTAGPPVLTANARDRARVLLPTRGQLIATLLR
jgi:hypothetical protein